MSQATLRRLETERALAVGDDAAVVAGLEPQRRTWPMKKGLFEIQKTVMNFWAWPT